MTLEEILEHNRKICEQARIDNTAFLEAASPEERAHLERMERQGDLERDCPACRYFYEFGHDTLAPGHKVRPWCRSGGGNHCTCDSCF